MSEFKRWYIGVYRGEAQARGCFPHTREIIRESEGVTFALASELEASLSREAKLQQRLNGSEELLEVWRTWLGPNRESCDEGGKQIWDRIDALKPAAGDNDDA